jgi:CO dehydrogenase maturation factor
MKIAVVGKGGVGKTSISGTLARLLARRGQRVLAIDGDPNPNLAFALGVPVAGVAQMRGLSPDLIEDGESGLRLTRPLELVLSEYAVAAPDGVTLLAMRPEEQAGAG